MVIIPGRRLGRLGNDSYTKLLLHLDGADAATASGDSSHSGHAVSFAGSAQLDTAQKAFGLSSAMFASASDYLSVANHADFDFGSGDFTIDMRARFNSLPAIGKYIWLVKKQDSIKLTIYNGAGIITLAIEINSPDEAVKTFGATISLDTWYHFAFVRNGSNWHLFQDGVEQGSHGSSASTIATTTNAFTIGVEDAACTYWIDELRVTKGLARWTASFTPPSSPYR
jgi:hypothetical protein